MFKACYRRGLQTRPPIRQTSCSWTINRSCSLARRPLASKHVSTGLWKHVYWPVETRTLASGNTYTAKWTTVERASSGQTHQNYSDKNCNISNCKALIINALDLLMLDKFRIFIV